MDANTFSTLNILAMGLVEDPHLYKQVIDTAVRDDDPECILKLAYVFRSAFDNTKPVASKDTLVTNVIETLTHMGKDPNFDRIYTEWAIRCLVNSLKAIEFSRKREIYLFGREL